MVELNQKKKEKMIQEESDDEEDDENDDLDIRLLLEPDDLFDDTIESDIIKISSIEELVPHFEAVHNALKGHFGVDRTMTLLHAAGIRMKDLRIHVSNLISNCEICSKLRARVKSKSFKPHALYGAPPPFEKVYIDLLQALPESNRGYKNVFTAVCAHTRMVFLEPIFSTNAEDVVIPTLKLFGRFGPAKMEFSDNGSNMVSKLNDKMLEMIGTKHRTILPGLSTGLGLVERVHGETIRHLQAIMYSLAESNFSDWDLYLPLVEWIINTTVHYTKGRKSR